MQLVTRYRKPARVRRFDSLFDQFMNRNLADFFGADAPVASAPAVNIKETETAFELELAAPGLERDNFDISTQDDVLTIRAERQHTSEENNEDTGYKRREFNYSSFARSFHLPEHIDADQIGAKYENGVLHLTLPKREEQKPEDTVRKIAVQ